MNDVSCVFPDVFAVFEHLTKEAGWSFGFHTAPQFEAMTLYDNRMAAAPMPMSPLFRGESEFHEKCLPSLFRKEWTPLQKLERQIQLEDFKQMLQVNPEIKEMEEGGLEVNYNGLAQHYGIETNILDLTNSFLVAAFFATADFAGVGATAVFSAGVIAGFAPNFFTLGPAKAFALKATIAKTLRIFDIFNIIVLL